VIYRLLADLLVLLHLGFVLFVALGGLLVLRWRRLMPFQLGAAIWGAWIEFTGGICPLTPLEQWLRRRGGGESYSGGFVEHYVLPVLYPAGLTPEIRWTLGAAVVALNLAIYWRVLRRSSPPRSAAAG